MGGSIKCKRIKAFSVLSLASLLPIKNGFFRHFIDFPFRHVFAFAEHTDVLSEFTLIGHAAVIVY